MSKEDFSKKLKEANAKIANTMNDFVENKVAKRKGMVMAVLAGVAVATDPRGQQMIKDISTKVSEVVQHSQEKPPFVVPPLNDPGKK